MKEAKFFCDSCGTEVERDARTCPNCDRLFTSGRGPRCGKTGSSNAFKWGCPVCGYSKPPARAPEAKPERPAPGPLPLWALCLAIAAAAAVAIGVVWALRPGQ